MIRPLLFLTAAAGLLAVAGCDRPSTLAKAQVGDCYTVVSKGSLGEPNLGKVPCSDQAAPAAEQATADGTPGTASPQTASAQAAGTQTVATPGQAAAPAGVCPKVPVCTPSGGASYIATSSVRPKVKAGKAAAHRRIASRGRSRSHTSGGGSRDYVGSGNDYAQVGEGEDVKRFASGTDARYSQSGSSSESSSSSSSGYDYSASSGACCTAAYVPGPHIPFDQYGFLTWPGKVPYQPYQPRR